MSEQEHTSPDAREKQESRRDPARQPDAVGSSLAGTPANVRRIGQLHEALEEICGAALRRGYFGDGTLQFAVHDGTIQEIRQGLERIHK